MEDMIKKLVDIDDKAKRLHKENEKQRLVLAHEIETQKKALHEKHMSQARSRVENETESVRNNAEESFRKNEKKREDSKKRLDSQFEKNGEKWIDEIVSRVLA